MTEQEQISRLQKDKDIMFENAKELQAENDYLKSIIEGVKRALNIDYNVDGYEIVLEAEKIMEEK